MKIKNIKKYILIGIAVILVLGTVSILYILHLKNQRIESTDIENNPYSEECKALSYDLRSLYGGYHFEIYVNYHPESNLLNISFDGGFESAQQIAYYLEKKVLSEPDYFINTQKCFYCIEIISSNDTHDYETNIEFNNYGEILDNKLSEAKSNKLNYVRIRDGFNEITHDDLKFKEENLIVDEIYKSDYSVLKRFPNLKSIKFDEPIAPNELEEVKEYIPKDCEITEYDIIN